MATIQKRKNKNGTSHWRAIVRIKGHPPVCNHFERKQEAEDWSQDIERKIKLGQYRPERYNVANTFPELVARYIDSGILEHHKSADDTLRHLHYWKERFASYALVHITPELISKERFLLLNTPTSQQKKRNPATVNRYFSTLSALLTYARRQLRWIDENPCFDLVKLKESSGRKRVLTLDEARRLFDSCKLSKNKYLYLITLIAITTGARQGEILSLQWDDIDFENRMAHIRDSKNGCPRSIALTNIIVEELQALYTSKNSHTNLVFASRKTITKIDIKKSFATALKRATISDFHFHDLRHTFATMVARQGATPLQIQVATGHQSMDMLLRYTHLDTVTTRPFTEAISAILTKETSDANT